MSTVFSPTPASLGLNVIRTAAHADGPDVRASGGNGRGGSGQGCTCPCCRRGNAILIAAIALYCCFRAACDAKIVWHPCSLLQLWNAIQTGPGQLNETILREGLDYTVR